MVNLDETQNWSKASLYIHNCKGGPTPHSFLDHSSPTCQNQIRLLVKQIHFHTNPQ